MVAHLNLQKNSKSSLRKAGLDQVGLRASPTQSEHAPRPGHGLPVPALPAARSFSGSCASQVTRASVSLRILPEIELRPQRNVSRRIWPPRQADERDREHPFLPKRHRDPKTPAQRTSSPGRSGAGALAEVALGGRSLGTARN